MSFLGLVAVLIRSRVYLVARLCSLLICRVSVVGSAEFGVHELVMAVMTWKQCCSDSVSCYLVLFGLLHYLSCFCFQLSALELYISFYSLNFFGAQFV